MMNNEVNQSLEGRYLLGMINKIGDEMHQVAKDISDGRRFMSEFSIGVERRLMRLESKSNILWGGLGVTCGCIVAYYIPTILKALELA